MKISIIGAGNGGFAMAAHFSLLGHNITLYNRNLDEISNIIESGNISVSGEITASVHISKITDNISLAVKGAEMIMITTTADAHREIASLMGAWVEDHQIIILNPGRTLGAIDFANSLFKTTTKRVFIAEAQSLIYACRKETQSSVRIIGIKNKVLLAAYPSSDTDHILENINRVYPCFVKAKNVLHTSLENIGAILHPTVVMFNAAAIERGSDFYFYNDMTSSVADFIENMDKERLMIGDFFGLKLHSVSEWVSFAYSNIEGDTFLQRIKNNKAYYQIKAPSNLNSRMLFEDIPTGILPMLELGRLAQLELPLMTSLLNISEALLKIDFKLSGRTLKNIGYIDNNTDKLIEMINK